MPYVNEYVPDKDVKEFGLNDAWNRYNLLNPVPHPGFRHMWTVDRGKDSFLMRVHIGREQEDRIHRFIFKSHDVTYEVVLEYLSSGPLDQSPFPMKWRLVRLNPDQQDGLKRDVLLSELHEALRVFGYWGIEQQVPNTIVELVK